MIYVNKADSSTLSATDNLFQTHFLVLLRKTNGISYAYIPKSPPLSISKDKQSQILEELALALQKELPKNIVFLRYDLLWSSFEQPENLRPELLELKMNYGTQTHNLRKAFRNFLPADSVVINLRLPPERLLMNMRQQTRNSIRRAYKEKIDFLIYDCSSPKLFEELKKWHEIYVNTAQRKGFYFEKYAYYMYAASSLKKRECMPNYGLQWEVIRFARSKGCTQYDLMGIPPNAGKYKEFQLSGQFSK